MPRKTPESGPVQEEPEQQINLEDENSNNPNKREKTVAEKLVELDAREKAVQEKNRPIYSGGGDTGKGTRDAELLQIIREREALLEAERTKAEIEKTKRDIELQKAKNELNDIYEQGQNG